MLLSRHFPPAQSSPSPHKTPIAVASACQAPPRPQSSVKVPVGGDASKKRTLSGPLRPPPDVQMNDAEAEAIAHQLAPDCTPAFNPADVVSDLSSFVSSVLGCTAGSTISTLSPDPTPELLIQLALAKKLQDIHATILSVKAKADHAQQVASSALNMASAAVNASRTYAQTAATAAPPKPPPSQNPRPKGQLPPTAPATPAAPASARSKKPGYSLPRPAPGLLAGPAQTLRSPKNPPEDSERSHSPTNAPYRPG